MTDPVASMIANLETNTGHDLDWWVDQAMTSGKTKHGEILTHLKAELGLSHGYANLVTLTMRDRLAGGPPSDEDLVASQYRGKEPLIPIYEGLLSIASQLGDDVEVAPKKASVSLRRAKQFALIEPATKTRIDLGLNIKGHPGTDRLSVAGGMCTHKVRISDLAELDDELREWMGQAYDQA